MAIIGELREHCTKSIPELSEFGTPENTSTVHEHE